MTDQEVIAALKLKLELENRTAVRLVEDISDIAEALGIPQCSVRDARAHILQAIRFLQVNQAPVAVLKE